MFYKQKLQGRKILLILFVLFLFITVTVFAQSDLSITTITWNVIGFDHNKPKTSGPDTYPVGVRIVNNGTETANNILASFIWDNYNKYIDLKSGTPGTLSLSFLAPGEHADLYFYVTVVRSKKAWKAKRSYHIEAIADGMTTVSTPIPREIYVEKLISLNSCTVNSLFGESKVYVGLSYVYDLYGIASEGSTQAEVYVTFPNTMFRILSSDIHFSSPEYTGDTTYADACGWDDNPLSPSYLSCIGPCLTPTCKVGGDVCTTYTVQVIDHGTVKLSSVMYNSTGNGYHYNNDYGSNFNTLTVVAVYPPTISGHIFKDLNKNGIQDQGEPGFANVDILVTDGEGGQHIFTTDSQGDYLAVVYAEGETTLEA